eukprot:Phypoly_transcript_13094.p1 GENE.Phypoly_transcript_13094~~Phypoly_transcript_13094.p1  ORF type:complete len:323 (+),score=33.47 Phypoly_transcript_13094:72-1040(+)
MYKESLLLLIVVTISSAQACSTLTTTIFTNSSLAVNLTTTELYSLNFLASVRASNSTDANNYISFALRDLYGGILHTFPSLTGQMTLAKLVSGNALPCETQQWPSSATLEVAFFSGANISIQIILSCVRTDFYGGVFGPGSVSKAQAITTLGTFYFSFTVPTGSTRYNVNFTLTASPPSLPFSDYCIGPLSNNSCNSTCLIGGPIASNTPAVLLELSDFGTGNYSASFNISQISVGVIISSTIGIFGVPTTLPTTTASSSNSSSTTSSNSSSTTSPSSTGKSTTTGNSSTTTSHSVTIGLPGETTRLIFSPILLVAVMLFAI